MHSRCSVVPFTIPNAEKPKLAAAFYRRVVDILTTEGIAFEPKTVAHVVEKHFPDFRRILNELQRYSSNANKTIDTGILVNTQDTSIKQLVGYMKTRDFTNVRKWVGENSDMEPNILFRAFYDASNDLYSPQGVAQLVLILAKYQYQQAFVIDTEINIVACLTEIMVV